MLEFHDTARVAGHAADAVSLTVRRAERVIEDEPDAPHSVECLARRVGVSARSLFRAFQLTRGYGPMEAVRRARLHQVRRDLLAAGPKQRVTDIAMRWGFFHLGRFAGVYCAHFGELPSRTRQRSTLGPKAA